MKRMAMLLAAALLAGLAVGCSPAESGFPDDADFVAAIESTRGDDLNSALPIVTFEAGGAPALATNPNGVSDEEGADLAQMTADTMLLSDGVFDEYAVSASLIITQAYAVGVFRPAEGQEDMALTVVQAYVGNVCNSFENYLPDQYDIAKQAIVRQYPSGELMLVMCADAETQADAMEKALGL